MVYAAIVLAAAIVVKQQTGVVLDPLKFHPALIAAPAGMIVLGAIAVAPAFKAYATDVAANLVATSCSRRLLLLLLAACATEAARDAAAG